MLVERSSTFPIDSISWFRESTKLPEFMEQVASSELVEEFMRLFLPRTDLMAKIQFSETSRFSDFDSGSRSRTNCNVKNENL